MTDVFRKPASPLETWFGPLEIHVLDSLWRRTTPAAVKDIQPDFPSIAYTTLMTTLDRLYRKGVLTREKSGRAFYYRPISTRAELKSQLAGSTLATLLPGELSSVRPILSMFVDAVGDRDRALLDELEALVKARREAVKKEG
jgi:predicted transcriptional regulator